MESWEALSPSLYCAPPPPHREPLLTLGALPPWSSKPLLLARMLAHGPAVLGRSPEGACNVCTRTCCQVSFQTTLREPLPDGRLMVSMRGICCQKDRQAGLVGWPCPAHLGFLRLPGESE